MDYISDKLTHILKNLTLFGNLNGAFEEEY
jgi:hypothetical protein